MSGVLLLLLQAATSTAAPAPSAGESLLHPIPPARCVQSPTEIVVCGKDAETYRLKQVGPQFDTSGSLPKAEWRLFGDTKMSLHAAQSSVGGFTAPAAMVTVTIPF